VTPDVALAADDRARAAARRRGATEALNVLRQRSPERARQALELTLACETAQNGSHESRTIADTHQLLAQAYRDLDDTGKALEHAREASRIFDRHNPNGRGARQARQLIEELSAG
jgi:hypothetical protein